jgi:hypothetical protein
MQNRLVNKFNDPETLGVISSYPAKNGEIARANAISRYSYLLSKSFPKNQKIVIFCEKTGKNSKPYTPSDNILVYPSYLTNNPLQFFGLTKEIFKFSKVKDFLIQFEFSIYGGKKVLPGFLIFLAILNFFGKNTSLVLHQVVSDLNDLSGHLGLLRGSFKVNVFNRILQNFYLIAGLLVNKIIVHDLMLKNRLSAFVDTAKIIIIPHAVGDMEIRSSGTNSMIFARRSLGLGSRDKVVGVYGYRSWYKGTDWIIQTVRQLALKYPGKNIKLLVAGGVSPTLKNTWSYKNFDRRIKRVIKNADGSVVVTGFVKEKDVGLVFAASDVMVFPYRTRISASGAFNLTLAYKKPFLVSKPFANGMGLGIRKAVFELDTVSFEQKFLAVLEDKNLRSGIISLGEKLAKNNSWENVANLYITSVKSARILVSTKDATDQSFVFSEA